MNDYFTLRQEGKKIIIEGNNANSMAVGLNHYLRYYCQVEIGWFKHDHYTLPKHWPDIPQAETIRARVSQRFFLNYCTYGYTMPWWNWDEWEHFIDWMALNGINLPLAITGQESIWYRIWTELGLQPEEVRAYFTGPAHLPWHRMQNIDRWGGPLPESWLDGQLELQKKITARERELNMRPVLPAFAGHVPRELSKIYPDAPITQLEAWAGYPDDYACSFLDPMSDLYAQIQKMFIEKETEIYGSDHIYGIDLFNELTPPSWEPDYLGRVSRQVYESLIAADKDATWLQMGWLFYNERENWTNDRVEAYLTSFPKDKQILLDYYCDRQEVWQRTESFYGVPYIWCYLGNFGGNTMLCGNLKEIDQRIENTFTNGGDNFSGIGSTLEGFDCNPYIYEYLFEKAWEIPQQQDLNIWIDALAQRRTQSNDEKVLQAWHLLIDSIYTSAARPGQSTQPCIRPSLGKNTTYYCNNKYPYQNYTLKEIIQLLLESEAQGASYEFDITNLTRQWMLNGFRDIFNAYKEAVNNQDRPLMDSLANTMLILFDDIDLLTGTQSYFLMGKWIADARQWGKNEDEALYFEQNARNLLTTWSDNDQVLNDYASRSYNGLLGSFYKYRYELFFEAINEALEANEEFGDTRENPRFAAYLEDVTTFEKQWWTDCIGQFSATPSGNSVQIAQQMLNKYTKILP